MRVEEKDILKKRAQMQQSLLKDYKALTKASTLKQPQATQHVIKSGLVPCTMLALHRRGARVPLENPHGQ